MKISVTILASFAITVLHGQSSKADRSIQTGNEYYKNKEYSKAAAEYNKALQEDPGSQTAKFNQGNALYRQDQKVEAVQLFTALSREADKKELRSGSFYNKGVILSGQKNLEESIEAYKNALRNDPADKDARENLQKALLELKKKAPPPKKEEKKDQKKQEQQQQQKQPQSKMSPKETEQRLKLLQQKEKEVQQRLQKEKSKAGGSQPKDW